MSLPGTIAITDFGWYEFLSRRESWEEVNFWTPSAHWAFRAPEFSPFLFKLKAPYNAIGGFGYFARYAPLPDWLAWECFSEGNGCASFDELRQRLTDIRRRFRYIGADSVPQIGCIVIVGATFFPREDWIRQPADWPVRTLRPTRYDLEVGEGGRVWAECLARLGAKPKARGRGWSLGVRENGERYGAPMLVRPRLGQGAFRVAVTEAYGRACAATGEHSLPALEAVHIRPFAKDGPHEVPNGLLLRADLHRLFEQGYVTVSPSHVLEISDRLRTDYQNGRTYYPLNGRRISLPASIHDRPSAELLQWHNDNVFLG
jgi:putative restriction endonuclease